jgi:hypothetical protein
MRTKLWKTFVVTVPPHIVDPVDFFEGYIYERGIDLIGKYTKLEGNTYELEAMDILEEEDLPKEGDYVLASGWGTKYVVGVIKDVPGTGGFTVIDSEGKPFLAKSVEKITEEEAHLIMHHKRLSSSTAPPTSEMLEDYRKHNKNEDNIG